MTPAAAAQTRFRFRIRAPLAKTPLAPVRLPWFVIFLMSYLAGITIIGKGPTYLGVPPVYWGELVMVAGLLLIAPQVRRTNFLAGKRLLTLEIGAFLALGTVLTAISFPQWGIDALRDAAIWYYALFYFIGMGLASHQGIARRAWSLVRIFWMLALLWNTVDILSHHLLSESGPVIPGRGVRLFQFHA